MAGERRAIVTENAVHFMPLVHESAALGSDHYGLVLTSPRRVPRFRGTIGLYVRLLHELLEAEPAEDALLNQVRWLMP